MQDEPSFFTQDILFTSPRNERCKRVLTEKTRGGQAKECKWAGSTLFLNVLDVPIVSCDGRMLCWRAHFLV